MEVSHTYLGQHFCSDVELMDPGLSIRAWKEVVSQAQKHVEQIVAMWIMGY